MTTKAILLAGGLLAALTSASHGQQQTLAAGVPYVQGDDLPFERPDDLQLETFEDGKLNLPGVTASTGAVLLPGPATDSVDQDDGVLDGLGTGGHSYRIDSGAEGVTFTFDPAVLGGLPRTAGLVWTDGVPASDVRIEFRDPFGAFLDFVSANPLGDGDDLGGTAEDGFFGAAGDYLIGSMTLRTTTLDAPDGPLELDHLQFGDLSAWYDLGGGLAGTFDAPYLAAEGDLVADALVTLDLGFIPPDAQGFLVLGRARADLPVLGGVLIPEPELFVPGIAGGEDSTWSTSFRWPADLEPGKPLFLQAWIQDEAGPQGWSASNAYQVGGLP